MLIVIDATDFAFAFDSVPAIFAFTNDPFIVFSSNVFAILGLRALYFLLAGVMDMFRYLKYGLSAILLFVGLKMLLHWVADPPPWWRQPFRHAARLGAKVDRPSAGLGVAGGRAVATDDFDRGLGRPRQDWTQCTAIMFQPQDGPDDAESPLHVAQHDATESSVD